MLELAEAVMRLKENFRKQKLTEVIPLSKSYGRIAAFDIPSPINVPNFQSQRWTVMHYLQKIQWQQSKKNQ
ncbi:hypothetical protein [Tetragenococcus halophilus]|uniref:hypothetical protein n=1 Tax=Tetragenococcus halophilus TaxID=51669 RepID=UPI0015BB4CE0|nr:hypothetical protein [Tetragenococcus halophilus]NWO00228.1 hypothetical protein [Tetragenococcus halophilus]